MALGSSRPRNWGVDAQQAALSVALARLGLSCYVQPVKHAGAEKRLSLWVAPARRPRSMPFTESCCVLVNVRRGRWEAQHNFDGRVLATGISERDVVRAVIEALFPAG